MATLSYINTKISNLTTTDTNQFPNSDRLIDLNRWLSNIVTMIFDSQDEDSFDDQRNTDYPILTASLTTNRDYAIRVAEDVLKINSVSICYDGVNIYRATPIDIKQFDSIGNAPSTATVGNSTVDAQFSRTSPSYSTKFNSLFLYPRATASDVAAGGYMIIEWLRNATPFTLSELNTGTVVPGFDSNFHLMLAYGVAYDYCVSKGLPQKPDIEKELLKYEVALRKQYASKQKDRAYSLSAQYQSYK